MARRPAKRPSPPMRSLRPLIVVIGCLALCGCPPPEVKTTAPQPPRTSQDIVGRINANNERIDKPLYASPAHVVAQMVDDHGTAHRYSLDGSLLVRTPHDFRLDLRHPIGEQVMQVAANAETFWLWVKPEVSTYWWGRFVNVGKPCADAMPLRPEQLAEVLGMRLLSLPRDGAIGPARLYGEQYDRLLYFGAAGGRYSLDREYWVERTPPYMVRLIMFRDSFGRRAMNANLDDYRPAWPNGPLVAHKISIDWPPSDGRTEGGKLLVTIDNWQASPPISRRAFVRPESPPGIERQVQVDRNCEQPTTDAAEPPSVMPTETAAPESQP